MKSPEHIFSGNVNICTEEIKGIALVPKEINTPEKLNEYLTPKQSFCIGIDAGTKTGIAVWNKTKKKFEFIKTVMLHQAFEIVKDYATRGTLLVIVEDARQATFGRKFDAHKAQGAGSIKRDCSAWEDFLTDLDIDFKMKRPNKAITKWSKEMFVNVTGYTGLTSNHSRDAAMLVYDM